MFLQRIFQVSALLCVVLILQSPLRLNAQTSDNAAVIYLALFEQLPKPETMSDEQRELLSNWKEAEINANARNVVALFEPAFQSLHRAAVFKNCDWSIRPKSNNPLPTVGLIDLSPKARELLNAVCLSSRLAFQEKQYRGAVDDLLDIMVFARHFQRGNSFIDSLIADVFEREATSLLASHLNEIRNPEMLKIIRQRYDALPPVVPLQAILLNEKKVMRTIMQQVPATAPGKEASETEKKEAEAAIKTMIAQHDEVIEQAAAVAALPPRQLGEATAAFEAKFKDTPGVAASSAKGFAKAILVGRHGIAQRAMFSAALAVQMEDVEQLKKHPDPFGSGPFEYRKLENGFELKSKLKDGKGEPVVLKVGN